MGQHLHIYSSPDITLAEAQAWCDCRCAEYFRVPALGFEADAEKKCAQFMSMRNDYMGHYEAGSTWATTIWPRLWWSAFIINDDLIKKCREDLQLAMLQLPAMPHSGRYWEELDIWGWLRKKRGCVAWGDNDGI